MIQEQRLVKRYFGLLFGYGEYIQDGMYAVPTSTSKGDAFMKIEVQDKEIRGPENFRLFWDEELTTSWYTEEKPENLKYSKLSQLFRKAEKEVHMWNARPKMLSEVSLTDR